MFVYYNVSIGTFRILFVIFGGNEGRGIFVLWIWGLMNQFLKDHQLNKAEFGVTDGSISVWISGPQDKNPSITIFIIYKADD